MKSTQDNLTRELNRLDEYEILALTAMLREYLDSKMMRPCWPSDTIHASAIVTERVGTLTSVCNFLEHEASDDQLGKFSDMVVLATTQTAAAAFRFLVNQCNPLNFNKK